MILNDFIEKIENVKVNYNHNFSDIYCELYNICIEYENVCDCMELFNDFIDYDTAEEIARTELEKGGLFRLKCFLLNDCDLNANLFRLDGYGNLEDVTLDTLENLREDILETIKAQK